MVHYKLGSMNILHASPQNLTQAPTPLTMESYRDAAFRAMVVRRMDSEKSRGQRPEQVAASIAAEQRALASTITDPALIDVAGDALLKAQTTITSNARYHSTPEQAREAMHQIMHRRAAEANHFADLLSQPNYVASLAALTPAEADAAVPPLRDVKMSEVLDDLLHLENGKPQVIAHIDATAKGAMLGHDALAAVFAPDGALRDALTKGLAAALPAMDKQQIDSIAKQWLGTREAAAKLTSELSANDGAAYREAVRQSTEWHRQPHDAPLATVTPATTVHAARLEKELSARAHEKEKNANQRAEDVAYTINHALSCGTTDVVLQPLIAAAFGVNVGCGDSSHDHKHDHSHEHHEHEICGYKRYTCRAIAEPHHHPKPKLTLSTFAHEAGHYLKGEIVGDFAAVPLTIAVQRLFPDFMNGIRKITDPLFGWAFRSGANRTARHWGQQQGLTADAPEVKAHAEEIYQHEVSHLPQAVVWNMFAYPLGAVAQKMGGHGRSYPEIFKSKLVGAIVSNGILIGGRMVAPAAAQKWDAVTSEKVFLPASKTIGKVFGVDEKAMERAAEKQKNRHAPTWTKRLEDVQQHDAQAPTLNP